MTIEVGNANNGIPMGAYVPSSGGSGGGAGSLKAVVVDTLPETGEEGILYLVPEQSSAGTNNFKEYIWLPDENKYEELGYTDIDLSDYYTKEETYAKTEVYNKGEVNALLDAAPGLPDVIDGGNAGSIAAVRYGISQAASFGRKYNNSLSTITDSWEEITQ